MSETANGKPDAITLNAPNYRIPIRIVLVTLGCFLLLRGNTLPWPCLPPPEAYSYCSPLLIDAASAAQLTLLLVTGCLLIALAVNLLFTPMDFVLWLVLLAIPYVLMVARLRPLVFLDQVAMYTPLVGVNDKLSGPSYLVMPLSLLAAWLTLRPRSLHKKWRSLAIIVLWAVSALTVYFLVLMGNRPYQVTVATFVQRQGLLSTGPLLILAGATFLLGAEYLASGRERMRVAAPKTGSAAATQRVNALGFWSALVALVSSVLPILTSLTLDRTPLMDRYDAGVYFLVNALRAGVSLLLPISVVVLMVSLCLSAARAKRIWPQVGLVFALVYAIMQVAAAFLQFVPSTGAFELYRRLLTIFPFLSRYDSYATLTFAFLCLACLFSLPVFNKRGLELAVRWCFVTMAGLTVISGMAYLLTNDRIPMLTITLVPLAEYIVFPVAMALVAAVFRSAMRIQTVTSAKLA
jgi:hypothetical protein